MYEQAQDLKKLHEESKKKAQDLLKRVIQTNNLGYALQVFQEVEELLPTTRWIPSRDEYPLFREYLDGYDHYRREGVYEFLSMFEEDIWYFVDATEEEQNEALDNTYGWDPRKSAPILWGVIKNGHGKFTLDW